MPQPESCSSDWRIIGFVGLEQLVADGDRFGGYAAEDAAHGGEKSMVAALRTGMHEPRRIWWARPRKLCALERPGGGGRSHRPERREAEIAWLAENGVRPVISTMTTRHNLAHYERAGLEWHHVPVASAAEGAEALEQLLPLLRRELRRARRRGRARQPPHGLRRGGVRRPPARDPRAGPGRRAARGAAKRG